MPIHDLTATQAAFWWAHGFFLALWCLATGQAPLPSPLLSGMPCSPTNWANADSSWTNGWPLRSIVSAPTSVYSFMPGLTWKKAHQLGLAFPHFDDQEFAYWFFNNKLETLDQLKDIIWYDITSIKDTELGKRVARGIDGHPGGLPEKIPHSVGDSDAPNCHHLPISATKLLGQNTDAWFVLKRWFPSPENTDPQIRFVEPEPNKTFHQYVHMCFLAIDIGFDCPLALMLANGHWNEITLEAYFDGLFMGDHTVFNHE
ncbi:hypothetical protein ARMSODRAFT_980968 [Armillaria solidipes]|uniref:Uncharacterized protein n=1 Tax=Armillaria solidipes TaxID=1076256 RepID=A0A2H3BEE5_9AGAR|nr:hypothetical protein ARMSODRAFT_980968 [Armillaria solidipes]